ncbi:MAG: tryptophan synthase subunit alpha [Salinisphaeraceae bacterium]|nr:tryptophan synthase subunit alpha [Salinisphaeraceae bacterium]
MNRLDACFARLKSENKKALIPYITAGDPHVDITLQLMHGLVAAGADVIEIGVPFSDPMADGPVIQAACERALLTGISLRDILELIARFREQDSETPVVLMGYLNPVEAMGYEHFAEKAAEAGVDGVLLVDLSAEEADEPVRILKAAQLSPVFLIAPTSPEQRVKRIGELGGGYLYYVSFKGVTGANRLDVGSVAKQVADIRQHSDLPVVVGFGIRDADSASAVSAVADGVVVGSALVSKIGALCQDEAALLKEVPAILAEMRTAMDSQK